MSNYKGYRKSTSKTQKYEELIRTTEEKLRTVYSMSRNPQVNKILEGIFNDLKDFDK